MISENQSNSLTERSAARPFGAIVFLSLVFKLALGAAVPLSPDEAYYWVWARHLDHGYFDHPPMVAWLFALGHGLESFGSAVRFPAILLGHATILVWSWILDDEQATKKLAWLGLFLACPLTGLGGIVVTPDLPLIFFISLSFFFVKRILDRGAGLDFLGLGVALGLGFLSKYHIVLLPLSLGPLLWNATIRQRLLRPPLLLTVLAGLVACSPVLGWNAARDWSSFRFQLHHGLASERFSWTWPAEYLLGQIVVIFPTVLWAASRNAGSSSAFRLLLSAAAGGPLLFFFMTSFKAPVEMNWPVLAYPFVFALAASGIGRLSFRAALTFWVSIQVLMLVSVFVPNRLNLHGKLAEPTKYRVLAELPRTRAPLFASTYQMASSLWFASQVPVYKLRGMTRLDAFDFWPGSIPPEQGTFYLLREEGQELPADFHPRSIRRLDSPAPGFELLEIET